MCIRQHSAPAAATTPAIPGSPRSAVTSFTSVAPASRARAATALLDESIEIWARAPRSISPSITGITRRSSSDSDTDAAPGRVDSPPTSRIAAPSASSSSPCAIAVSAAR